MRKETLTILLCGMATLTVLGLIVAISKTGHNKKAEKQDFSLGDDEEDDNYVTFLSFFLKRCIIHTTICIGDWSIFCLFFHLQI